MLGGRPTLIFSGGGQWSEGLIIKKKIGADFHSNDYRNLIFLEFKEIASIPNYFKLQQIIAQLSREILSRKYVFFFFFSTFANIFQIFANILKISCENIWQLC